jgi:hypothetical protein
MKSKDYIAREQRHFEMINGLFLALFKLKIESGIETNTEIDIFFRYRQLSRLTQRLAREECAQE